MRRAVIDNSPTIMYITVPAELWGPEPFLSALQKVIFFAGLLHPEELAPHVKHDACGYLCLQIWSRILHNWHFSEIFVQIPKTILAKVACKKLYAACTNKTSP